MVSIIILAIAILPMVGMFDMGLNSATTGSNYDKARALANLKLEEAKSLPFETVKDNFPEGDRDPVPHGPDPPDHGAAPTSLPKFQTYVIEKQYMDGAAYGQPRRSS